MSKMIRQEVTQRHIAGSDVRPLRILANITNEMLISPLEGPTSIYLPEKESLLRNIRYQKQKASRRVRRSGRWSRSFSGGSPWRESSTTSCCVASNRLRTARRTGLNERRWESWKQSAPTLPDMSRLWTFSKPSSPSTRLLANVIANMHKTKNLKQ